jgi:flavodoxin
MKTCIIFHSYSGITRGIAGQIRSACGGDLIEVKSLKKYHRLTVYAIGSMRARNGDADPIDPGVIDVSPYELLVIGTPVWAWRPTPATNAAITALKNCGGKKAVLFATCGSQAGETLDILAKTLEAKGVSVQDRIVLTRKETGDETKVNGLITAVRSGQGTVS